MSRLNRIKRLMGRACWRLVQMPESVVLRLYDQVSRSCRAGSPPIPPRTDPGYQPVDWQRDPVSGHLWDAACWYRDIDAKPGGGVDIKRPWERARMHHWPQLAYACAGADAPLNTDDARYRLFRNELLDFVSHNPPRFGIHWQCAMEVGIRAVNWVVALDWFKQSGIHVEPEVDAIITRSLYAHGRHIAGNLETGTLPVFLANHYLADIVGLLFIAAKLPCSPDVDRWLAFGVQELLEAVYVQYATDGGNVEASTCYHALSSEMVVYATALVLGLGDEKRAALRPYQARRIRLGSTRTPLHVSAWELSDRDGRVVFPDWYVARLEGMADFLVGIEKGNAEIPQIGDNDSGRLLVMTPSAGGLDHGHVVASCGALCDRPDWQLYRDRFPADYAAALALSGGRKLSSRGSRDVGVPAFRAFADFGLYVYRRDQVYVAVRCGHIGQNGNGGHAHNDQLSFEFAMGAQNIVVDPGTYVYTPDPDGRDRFRSTAMHNVMMPPGVEQNRWPSRVFGLFMLNDEAHARTIKAVANEFVGQHDGYGFIATRAITIGHRDMAVVDSGGTGERQVWFHLAPGIVPVPSGNGIDLTMEGRTLCRLDGEGAWSVQTSHYSGGYGLIQATTCVCLVSSKSEIRWELRW